MGANFDGTTSCGRQLNTSMYYALSKCILSSNFPSMATLPPEYLPPPRGLRLRHNTGRGGFTRRNPDTGPYGVFISYQAERVSACRLVDVHHYRPFWNRATPHIKRIFWGSENEREGAKIQLKAINEEIEVKNVRELFTLPGEGGIEVENWYEAGHQLKLAVRDALYYNSTARYEDIRDFIWERIQNRLYPINWGVKRSDFERKFRWHKRIIDRLNREIDTDDGAYAEQQSRPARRQIIRPGQETRTDRITRSQTRQNPPYAVRPTPRDSGLPAGVLQVRQRIARPPRGNGSVDRRRVGIQRGLELHESPRLRHLATIR